MRESIDWASVPASERPCSKCGQNPRHVFPSGPSSQCLSCLQATWRKRSAKWRITETTTSETALDRTPPPPLSIDPPMPDDPTFAILADMLALIDQARQTMVRKGDASFLDIALQVNGAVVRMSVGGSHAEPTE